MEGKTLNDFGVSCPEMSEMISLRDAYLAMFDFLESHWEGCWNFELGEVLSTLALWDNTQGDQAPMDSAILPAWIEAVRKVKQA